MIGVFDIGGTHLRVSTSRDGHSLREPVVLDTPVEYAQGVKLLVATTRTLTAGGPIRTIVGGVPGPLDPTHTMIENAPNLPGWNNQPLAAELTRALGAPVRLENDTALNGLGEAVAGAGRNHALVAYLTFSTGVNGVRIVDRTIDRNSRGFEIGHQIISAEPILCPTCQLPGHLEGLIGGRALEARFGKSPARLKREDQTIWDDVLHYAAIGVYNLLLYWSPELVVIGGGMASDIGASALATRVRSLMKIWSTIPPIVPATLGDVSGLHGALHLAQQSLG